MYSITTTNGFIIDSRPYGEAGKLMFVFTRDLGLVRATAQGIRLEKSKLRYHSQLYSFGIFSFVRGKEFWRLTSADELSKASIREQSRDEADTFPRGLAARGDLPRGNVVGEVKETVSAGSNMILDLTARLALLLNRLLHGEEAHTELFDCVFECVKFLNCNNPTEDQTQTLESLIVARILHKLGYIGDDKELNGHLQSIEITVELLESLKIKRTILNKHINKALNESHL